MIFQKIDKKGRIEYIKSDVPVPDAVEVATPPFTDWTTTDTGKICRVIEFTTDRKSYSWVEEL